MKARKDAAEDKKLARLKHEEIEARRVAAEERRIALEEKKNEMMEHEKYLFFMDTSRLDERQKEYVNLCHDQLLMKKKMMGGGIGASIGGMGGGIGASMGGGYGGVGASMGGGYEGVGASMGGMMGGMRGGMGGVIGASMRDGYGGVGASMGCFATSMRGM